MRKIALPSVTGELHLRKVSTIRNAELSIRPAHAAIQALKGANQPSRHSRGACCPVCRVLHVPMQSWKG